MAVKKNNFEMPKKLVLDEDSANERYGLFTAEPFEKGFGHTVGNSLRRVLLSSLEGAAITWIKIDGVVHEFAPIKDVVEDVIDIVLNLKKVKFKTEENEPRRIELVRDKKGKVTAADIQTDGTLEVVNPEQFICTLDKNTPLRIEMEVRKGRGYRDAKRNKPEDAAIGVIPIDSLFSPVERVEYEISDTRLGQVTDYDKLEIKVWTDGRIEPEEAVKEASAILRSHLAVFADTKEEDTPESLISDSEDESLLRKMLYNVTSIELSVRAQNCLENANIKLLGELVQKTESEMLKYRNFGKKSLDEIKERMSEMNLSLNMKIKEEVKLAFLKTIERDEVLKNAT